MSQTWTEPVTRAELEETRQYLLRRSARAGLEALNCDTRAGRAACHVAAAALRKAADHLDSQMVAYHGQERMMSK